MSVRQSSISGRQTSSAAMAKLIEKKKEFDAVAALERASALYLQRIEALGEDCEVMAKAGEVHGQVLEQWPRMFQILNLFLASREKQDAEDTFDGQRLVRLPIDELQQQASE
ncbi:hypothetical protein AGABI2DRAFT_117832 [Agaricus bisporus var. bisporus H97]|nr:hypothetical protein AGABI2DRAFT_117832 [Agaricus bisporus var. bisporus H97]EKV47264.1 hypothetical protein AGABI2DRAFT_117832 [Agaricus bisporus var. bisporus H97]